MSSLPINSTTFVLCSFLVPLPDGELKLCSSVFSVIYAQSINFFSSLPAAAVCINDCFGNLVVDDIFCLLDNVFMSKELTSFLLSGLSLFDGYRFPRYIVIDSYDT